MSPNLVIFRDDEEGFIEVDLDEEFNVVGAPRYFNVASPDDNYITARDDHIILAYKIEGGSCDLERYAINEEDNTPSIIWSMEKLNRDTIIKYLCEQFLLNSNEVN